MRQNCGKVYQKIMILLVAGLFVLSCATKDASTQDDKPKPDNGSVTESVTKGKMTGHLAGTVSYRERIALIQPFWLEVELNELKENGQPGPIVAKTMVEQSNQVPVSYNLEYSTKQINAKKKYGLTARIFSNDQLLFTNQSPVIVFQGEDPKMVNIETQRFMGS